MFRWKTSKKKNDEKDKKSNEGKKCTEENPEHKSNVYSPDRLTYSSRGVRSNGSPSLALDSPFTSLSTPLTHVTLHKPHISPTPTESERPCDACREHCCSPDNTLNGKGRSKRRGNDTRHKELPPSEFQRVLLSEGSSSSAGLAQWIPENQTPSVVKGNNFNDPSLSTLVLDTQGRVVQYNTNKPTKPGVKNVKCFEFVFDPEKDDQTVGPCAKDGPSFDTRSGSKNSRKNSPASLRHLWYNGVHHQVKKDFQQNLMQTVSTNTWKERGRKGPEGKLTRKEKLQGDSKGSHAKELPRETPETKQKSAQCETKPVQVNPQSNAKDWCSCDTTTDVTSRSETVTSPALDSANPAFYDLVSPKHIRISGLRQRQGYIEEKKPVLTNKLEKTPIEPPSNSKEISNSNNQTQSRVGKRKVSKKSLSKRKSEKEGLETLRERVKTLEKDISKLKVRKPLHAKIREASNTSLHKLLNAGSKLRALTQRHCNCFSCSGCSCVCVCSPCQCVCCNKKSPPIGPVTYRLTQREPGLNQNELTNAPNGLPAPKELSRKSSLESGRYKNFLNQAFPQSEPDFMTRTWSQTFPMPSYKSSLETVPFTPTSLHDAENPRPHSSAI